MKLVELTEFLVKSIAKEPDMVTVKEIDSDDDKVIIEVLVTEADMPIVIGRSGNNANAIRTIVQASSYISDNKYVRININCF